MKRQRFKVNWELFGDIVVGVLALGSMLTLMVIGW